MEYVNGRFNTQLAKRFAISVPLQINPSFDSIKVAA